jgi:acetyl-CoA C-acetyltransferase
MKREVYIVGGIRTPFVKSFTQYKGITTQKLMDTALAALVDKYQLQGQLIGDVALGALITSSRYWNLARESVLSSGLSPDTPAYNVQRACGTSLETAYQIYAKIALGFIDEGIAGGVDTNSDAPFEIKAGLREMLLNLRNAKSFGEKVSAMASLKSSDIGINAPAVVEPRTKLSMGQHCELMVKEWKISQAEQDQVALLSHQHAAKAYRDGFYNDLVTPVAGVAKDSFIRENTSIEQLAKLKPAFDKENGTITAGNASPLSDGASCVLLTSKESAVKNNWPMQAKLVDFQVTAVDFVGGAGLLMAPTKAVSNLLIRNNLKLTDFDYYEIHEAFAGQVLSTLKAWDSESYCREVLKVDQKLGRFDTTKMNTVGGSIALGHPFAATGGRILASLAKQLQGSRKRGLISICTAGGMGIAAIVEGV